MDSISSMPSASLVSSNVSSSGSLIQVTSTTSMATSVTDPNFCGEGPLGQALQIVEKKVRNLEKRKGKLDGYRADYQRGKTLNDDQKAAIAKYDEVLQTLEFARELSGQFKTLALEEEKNRKKQIKKEQRERNKMEIERVASTLEIQDLLKCMSSAKSKADFTSGENGATPKLSKEQIRFLEDFGGLIRPSRRQHETPEEFEKDLATSAEHLASLIEGKSKKVGKTTYKDLKTTLDGIKASGYFDGKNLKAAEVSDGNEEATNEASIKDTTDGIATSKEGSRKKASLNSSGEHEKREGGRREKKRGAAREERSGDKGTTDSKLNDQPKQRQQHEAKPMASQGVGEPQSQALQKNHVYQSVPSHQTNLIAESSHQPVPMAADSTQQPISNQQYHQAQVPQQMAVPATASGPAINFLQGSQIDVESPHMDPAVVVVHTAPPSQGQTALLQANQQPNVATTVQNQVHIMHHQATLQQPVGPGGIPTTISGFTNQTGAPSTIAFMPQTALAAMQQQQHVVYGQAPFQHQQPQQVSPVPTQPQEVTSQRQQVATSQEQKPTEEQQQHQVTQEPKEHHVDDSQTINTGAGGPSAVAVKPQGCAAAAASTNGASYAQQVQQNEPLQDTMATIDDWNAEDAGITNSGTSEQRADKGTGFRSGGGRGFRGGRGGGERSGRNNQNGDRGGYRGGNSGFRGSERGGRGGDYGSRRGGGRGGGSGEWSERGRGQDKTAGRGERGGKDFRGGERGSGARGGRGGRGGAYPSPSMANGISEQKVH